jgi:uncharacterized repeat protein (TIGR01451 family)
MRRPVRLFVAAILVLGGLLAGSPAAAATGYTITDLGTLGGDGSTAHGINTAGDVAGTSNTSSGAYSAFRWKGGIMTSIGTLGGFGSEGWDISDSGWVAGTGQTSATWFQAFWWAGTDPHPIGTLGGHWSEAYAINDANQIVGRSENATGQVEAFSWAPGTTMVGLGSLGPGTFSDAYGINDAGVIVGESGTAAGGTHAFSYADGVMTDLGTPSPNFSASWARDINDGGTIVGGVQVTNSYALHPFVRSPVGAWDVITEVDGYADAVNAAGTVVGTYFTPAGESAFIYENGVLTDLNQLLPSGSGWNLAAAFDINDRGQIVGEGMHNGEPRAFRLDPTRIAADVGVSLTASPDPLLAGTPATFTATVTNHGPFEATSIQLDVDLPVNATFVTCAADGGGVCSGANSQPTVTFPGLASGAVAHATFTVGSPASAADGVEYGASAAVSATEADPGPTNDTATALVTISNNSDLAVTASQDRDRAKAGQTVRQTFVVGNNGPGASGSVAFDEVLAPGLQVVSVSASAPCTSAAGSVHCDFGTLQAGASRTVTVAVLVGSSGGAERTSTATVSSPNHDPAASNDGATLVLRVTGGRGK